MRHLFATDDWLARHPRLILTLMTVAYIAVCTLEVN